MRSDNGAEGEDGEEGARPVETSDDPCTKDSSTIPECAGSAAPRATARRRRRPRRTTARRSEEEEEEEEEEDDDGVAPRTATTATEDAAASEVMTVRSESGRVDACGRAPRRCARRAPRKHLMGLTTTIC